MNESELIQELQKRIQVYGDLPVIMRLAGDDDDIDILTVYGDEDSRRIVISDDYFS